MIYDYNVERAELAYHELSIEAFMDTLGVLVKLSERYLDERPVHHAGFCSWAASEHPGLGDACTSVYDTVSVLRGQPEMVEAYGTDSWVDDQDGPTPRRCLFVSDLHRIAAHLLRESGLAA